MHRSRSWENTVAKLLRYHHVVCVILPSVVRTQLLPLFLPSFHSSLLSPPLPLDLNLKLEWCWYGSDYSQLTRKWVCVKAYPTTKWSENLWLQRKGWIQCKIHPRQSTPLKVCIGFFHSLTVTVFTKQHTCENYRRYRCNSSWEMAQLLEACDILPQHQVCFLVPTSNSSFSTFFM